ncbi:hypothetical protein [Bradyrhizobium jicamae]|uniref:hypothetical protein n=1 Tax=Bradyrhizobium jicamae TaxID=280332 RepID=UPI002012D37C|nr:hypothetical protein [Bradyrhizobium jicamae]
MKLQGMPELVSAMTTTLQVRMTEGRKRHGGLPLVVAAVVAILGVVGMLIVDHGPWSKPRVQTAANANYSTTGEAARAAGAAVNSTEPRARIEPAPPGPRPVQPVNPDAPH